LITPQVSSSGTGSGSADPDASSTPAGQALLVLACLRTGETIAELAAGFGISTAATWRYVAKTAALPGAPSLDAAPGAAEPMAAGDACRPGHDGKLIQLSGIASAGRETAGQQVTAGAE